MYLYMYHIFTYIIYHIFIAYKIYDIYLYKLPLLLLPHADLGLLLHPSQLQYEDSFWRHSYYWLKNLMLVSSTSKITCRLEARVGPEVCLNPESMHYLLMACISNCIFIDTR